LDVKKPAFEAGFFMVAGHHIIMTSVHRLNAASDEYTSDCSTDCLNPNSPYPQ
jgi:hypothetical protein